jgi:hypothetical protein
MGTIANLVEIKAREKFNYRHVVDIPRIKFFAQHRYRPKLRSAWPFMDGHYLIGRVAVGFPDPIVIPVDWRPITMMHAILVLLPNKILTILEHGPNNPGISWRRWLNCTIGLRPGRFAAAQV